MVISMKNKYLIGGVIGGIMVICLVSIIIMNGQNVTKLKCVKEGNGTGIRNISTINFKFKDNKMNIVESKSEVIVTDETYKKNIDLVYSALQEQFASAKDDKGVIVKPTKKSDSVTITVTVDAKKSPDQVSLVGSSITNEMNYEKAKETLEKQGYSCK